MKSVLFLPSWYPSRLDAFTGDFIQRHAVALSQFIPVHVVFIIRDKNKSITDSIKIEENHSGNLTETIIYFACKNYHLRFIDKLIALHKYHSVYKQYFLKFQTKLVAAVHVHVPYKAGLVALWLKNKYRLDYYLTEHWAGYDKINADNFYSRSVAFRYITRKIIRNAKQIVTVSKDLSIKLNSIEPGLNSKVISNAVNETLFYFEKAKPKIFRFIHYVSSWKGQKNTEGIIRTFSQLQKTEQEWECIMYGPIDQELREQVTAFGLNQKIKFTGEIPYESVAEIVRSASAFVCFSNYENQPCSILEALCCGVPVIATMVGGIPEVINQNNGILIEPQNEPQLLTAMEKVMKNYEHFNPESIANDAKQKYSYSTIGKQLSSLYLL
jgi:glycosyltransferase involved in cell wall biosynthesis